MDKETLKYRLDIIFGVNWLKTLWFNLKYFPISIALKLPCYIYRRTKINNAKGNIKIDCAVRRGMVRIGKRELDAIDNRYSRTVFDVKGSIIFQGNAVFGRGSKISVNEGGMFNVGDGFVVMGNSTFICGKYISIGGGVLVSWDVLIMDHDAHKIYDHDNNLLNEPKPITIGNDVWIGCRSTILKGVEIPGHCVIAAGSLLTKSFDQEHSIIGGSGIAQRILKSDINWQR